MKTKTKSYFKLRAILLCVLCDLLCFLPIIHVHANPMEQQLFDRVNELVQLINSGDRVKASTYIKKHYAPELLKSPFDEHLVFLSFLHDQSRGVEVVNIQCDNSVRPSKITILLKTKLTNFLVKLIVWMAYKPPYLITGLRLQIPQQKIQDQNNESKKLSQETITKEVDELMNKLANADLFSGTILLAHHGNPFYIKAFGQANRDFSISNQINTKFNLASMNKMFTAVAIAQLVEKGKISFEDPIAKYLPDFIAKKFAKKIKIKHLLSHTSGLGNYFNKNFDDSSKAKFRTVNDFMKLIVKKKPTFEPGTHFQYSNTGFLVLGAIIERVTGKNYYEYIREKIYRPAGMMNSDAYELDFVNQNLAVGYHKEFTNDGVQYKNNLFSNVIRGGPAGGGYSTVEDLLKFDIALHSYKLLSEKNTKLLYTPKPELRSKDLQGSDLLNYGYGFDIDPQYGFVGHGGFFIGVSTQLSMFLKEGYTFIMLSNLSHYGPLATLLVKSIVIPLLSHGE